MYVLPSFSLLGTHLCSDVLLVHHLSFFIIVSIAPIIVYFMPIELQILKRFKPGNLNRLFTVYRSVNYSFSVYHADDAVL